MKIGVIGGGVVGRATARCFMEHAEVRVHDILPERTTHSLDEVLACDLVFLCLPTPQQEGSLECDLSVVEEFFQLRTLHGVRPHGEANYVLKSTVPPGTTRRLREQYGLPNLIHSPEFLTARCAVTDAHLPARNIIGGEDCPAKTILAALYLRRFPGVPLYLMSSDESELVKLIQNSFFAVKVAYFNEVRTLVDHLKASWTLVLEAVLADGRISHSHTLVPGPDGLRGFGGTCLPKDLANLEMCMNKHELHHWVTSAARIRNEKWDRKFVSLPDPCVKVEPQS